MNSYATSPSIFNKSFLLIILCVIPSQISNAEEAPISFVGGIGDKISLHQNRLGQSNMYGFGIEASTLYYKSASIHRWYIGDNADGGSSDLMQLSDGKLLLNVNVGIGTSTPDYKLDVNGAIRAKEFFVETGWADFVFEEDYRLPSLEEVRSHIAHKGHLPGVPSAAEVRAEGLEMGQAQTLMMQKIEELTLYMIDLSEENAALKTRVRQLEAAAAARQARNP